MRIAVLYICTGRYNIFFESFYRSCEKYFIPNSEKTYFVFSDHEEIAHYSNVRFCYKKCEGFPLDSLFRFRTFLSVEDELIKFDYLYFFNSNIEFVSYVDKSILPSYEDGFLCCLDADYDKIYPSPCFYPYERNKRSLAYVPRGLKKYRYFHAGVNGGRAKEYLEMCKILRNNIERDYENGIIAIYHDESHINKFFSNHLCKELHSEYGTPEGGANEDTAKIIIVDKTKYGSYFEKGRSSSLLGKTKKMFTSLKHIIRWYF